MTHRYLVALIKPSRLYSGNRLDWDKQLPYHMIDTSSSTYYYNTSKYRHPSFACLPATPAGTLCTSPNIRSRTIIILHIKHSHHINLVELVKLYLKLETFEGFFESNIFAFVLFGCRISSYYSDP